MVATTGDAEGVESLLPIMSAFGRVARYELQTGKQVSETAEGVAQFMMDRATRALAFLPYDDPETIAISPEDDDWREVRGYLS